MRCSQRALQSRLHQLHAGPSQRAVFRFPDRAEAKPTQARAARAARAVRTAASLDEQPARPVPHVRAPSAAHRLRPVQVSLFGPVLRQAPPYARMHVRLPRQLKAAARHRQPEARRAKTTLLVTLQLRYSVAARRSSGRTLPPRSLPIIYR